MANDSRSDAHYARFPATHRSVVLALGSDDPAARARSFDTLARAYYRPVYGHVRLRWKRDRDDARDLTQAFFASAFERRFFADYDPARSHFRTFLKLCLDRFVAKEARDRRRLKRGGGAVVLGLDFDAAETDVLSAAGVDVEAAFDRAWVRGLLDLAVERLRERCRVRSREAHFAMFEAIALADAEARPSYAALAVRHGVAITDVTNYLAATRREFRTIVLAVVRELTSSDEEYRAEARALLGVEP